MSGRAYENAQADKNDTQQAQADDIQDHPDALRHVARGWQLLIEADCEQMAEIIERAGREAFGDNAFSEAVARAVESA